MRFVDVASNVCLALSCGVVRGAVAGGRGRAMQDDPFKSTLKAPGTERLKLKKR